MIGNPQYARIAKLAGRIETASGMRSLNVTDGISSCRDIGNAQSARL
jgi:hypothetical protein